MALGDPCNTLMLQRLMLPFFAPLASLGWLQMIDQSMLTAAEVEWLNTYHTQARDALAKRHGRVLFCGQERSCECGAGLPSEFVSVVVAP